MLLNSPKTMTKKNTKQPPWQYNASESDTVKDKDNEKEKATTLAISCFLFCQRNALQPEDRLKAESKLSLLVEARLVWEEYSSLQLAWLLVRHPDQGGALVHLELHICCLVNMSIHLKISSNTMSRSMSVVQSLLEQELPGSQRKDFRIQSDLQI